MTDLENFDYYLVLDLEATCCDRNTIPRSEMEIIEIGAVMVDARNLAIVDEFQMFVQPIRHPILTEFCKSLTSITQTQVEYAPTYPQAIDSLKAWLSPYSNTIFGSWSNFDRIQFEQDSAFHHIPYPIPFSHTDLRQKFSDSQGLRGVYGRPEALKLVGLSMEGRNHRGIDDARNIAKLLPYILGKRHYRDRNYRDRKMV
jgi:inhibitor of KinA sporulation pathway (predicted exonuclease)